MESSIMADVHTQLMEVEVMKSIYTSEEEFTTYENDAGLICVHFCAFLELPENFSIIFNDDRKQKGTDHEKTDGLNLLSVQHLPPIELTAELPTDYPSVSMPNFHLSCIWLPLDMLMKLPQRLEEIWQQNEFEEILFLWTRFLKLDLFDYLNLDNRLVINLSCFKRDRCIFKSQNEADILESSKEIGNVENKMIGMKCDGDWGINLSRVSSKTFAIVDAVMTEEDSKKNKTLSVKCTGSNINDMRINDCVKLGKEQVSTTLSHTETSHNFNNASHSSTIKGGKIFYPEKIYYNKKHPGSQSNHNRFNNKRYGKGQNCGNYKYGGNGSYFSKSMKLASGKENSTSSNENISPAKLGITDTSQREFQQQNSDSLADSDNNFSECFGKDSKSNCENRQHRNKINKCKIRTSYRNSYNHCDEKSVSISGCNNYLKVSQDENRDSDAKNIERYTCIGNKFVKKLDNSGINIAVRSTNNTSTSIIKPLDTTSSCSFNNELPQLNGTKGCSNMLQNKIGNDETEVNKLIEVLAISSPEENKFSNCIKNGDEGNDNCKLLSCFDLDNNPKEIGFDGSGSGHLLVTNKCVCCKESCHQARVGKSILHYYFDNFFKYIQDYNDDRIFYEFRKTYFNCTICFEAKKGLHCMQIKPCNHVFCKDCISHFIRGKINDGTVYVIKCPEIKCGSDINPSQIRDVVGPDEFARYDNLLLTTTLQTMTDITLCPRPACQYPVSRELDEKMATCPSCKYVFCVFCRMVYHGVEACRFKNEEKMALVERYTQGTDEEKQAMEHRYGRKQLVALVQASLSETWIVKNSQNCPHCNASIEKNGGCNKMVCWRCSTYFCWICQAQLDPNCPYLHYNDRNSRCYKQLFQGADISDNEDEGFIAFEDIEEEEEFEFGGL